MTSKYTDKSALDLMKKEIKILKRQREEMAEKRKIHLEAARTTEEHIEHMDFLIMDYEEAVRKVEG
jgi:hypothetical protein